MVVAFTIRRIGAAMARVGGAPQPCPRCRELEGLRRQVAEQQQQLAELSRLNLERRAEILRLQQECAALRSRNQALDAAAAGGGPATGGTAPAAQAGLVQRRLAAPSIGSIPLGSPPS